MTNEKFSMQQGSVEEGLLAATKSMDQWLQVSQFDVDDFTVRKDLFLFISQYLQQYGSLPSSSQISTRFTWSPPIGDFAYWLDEMKRYTLARRLLEVLNEGFDKVATPSIALALMMDKLSLLRTRDTHHIQAYDASATERLSMFDNRTEAIFKSHKLLGIPTGIRVLDDTLIGWLPGSLVGIYARPTVGKTWWLMWYGLQAWLSGYTVLAIAPEMPANFLNLRVDTLAGALLNCPIEYNALLKGDPTIRENYEKITSILSGSQRWWTYDSVNDRNVGIGELATLIRQHKPDIVLIDGVARMRSNTGRSAEWEKMMEVCYGLKDMATIYEVPILVTHWAINLMRGRKVNEEHVSGRGDTFVMPSLNDAAYGDSFVQSCSDVITMVPDELSPHITWFSIKKHRERGWANPLPSRMALATDYGNGKIIDLSIHGFNPGLVGEESRRLLNL